MAFRACANMTAVTPKRHGQPRSFQISTTATIIRSGFVKMSENSQNLYMVSKMLQGRVGDGSLPLSYLIYVVPVWR